MTDPDATPPLDRRTARRLALVPLAAAVLFVGFLGWVRLKRHDRERANALYGIGRPHTDAEFAELLALAGSRDPQARILALSSAASTADPARQEAVERVAVPLLDSPEPDARAAGLTALGVAGREAHRDRLDGFRTDPEPIVRLEAERAIRRLDMALAWALTAVERPLTDREFDRMAGLCADRFDDDSPAWRVVEAAAGRSADHCRAARALFDRLAADGTDPRRQAMAAEVAARLKASGGA